MEPSFSVFDNYASFYYDASQGVQGLHTCDTGSGVGWVEGGWGKMQAEGRRKWEREESP